MSRSLKARMLALLIASLAGAYFIVFDVLQVRIASQPFPVTVLVPNAAGLYAGANVTYRGVQVGTVTALDLRPGDVAIKLGINSGTRIPDNGTAHIKELSALGENYIDLQPSSAAGPDLHAGSVIAANRVLLPTQIGTALVDLGSLLSSVNGQDVQTFENFLTTAFVGTGPDLRTIIVTGQQLFDALVAAQPETVNLINDGQTDLQTLQATSNDFATFNRGLASLTGQLAASNSDIQGLIRNSQAAAQEINPFLASEHTAIDGVIYNLAIGSAVSNAYQPQVQAMFQLLPVVSSDLATVAGGGQVHGELAFNTVNTVCPYILGSQMPGPTQRVSTPVLTNSCPTSAPDLLQRGAPR